VYVRVYRLYEVYLLAGGGIFLLLLGVVGAVGGSAGATAFGFLAGGLLVMWALGADRIRLRHPGVTEYELD
jgi:hypothetical protein